MKEIINNLLQQAEDEKNLDLVMEVDNLMTEIITTYNCPRDWHEEVIEIAMDCVDDTWVSEQIDLYNYIDVD